MSFNTAGPAGIALQGEYSYRKNQPVQYATPELLLAALGQGNLITGTTQIPGQPAGVTTAFLVPDGTYIQGYDRLKMSQFQMTATKSVPNFAGADQLVMLGDFGVTYFHSMPTDKKFNGPGVLLPARAVFHARRVDAVLVLEDAANPHRSGHLVLGHAHAFSDEMIRRRSWRSRCAV